jgi:hypothetical protein
MHRFLHSRTSAPTQYRKIVVEERILVFTFMDNVDATVKTAIVSISTNGGDGHGSDE